jgi:hypothetical protein
MYLSRAPGCVSNHQSPERQPTVVPAPLLLAKISINFSEIVLCWLSPGQ